MDKNNSLLLCLFASAGILLPARAEDPLPTCPDEPSPLLFDKSEPSPLAVPPGMEAPKPTAAAATPSQNVTINLIRALVKKGVLSPQEAEEMINQAEQEAAAAREQAGLEPLPGDAVRVTYIPETVKQQIRDQLKQDVLDQARAENWAAPNKFSDWTERIKLFGDVRIRYESNYFPLGNDNTGSFPNFNSINTGAPFDTSGTIFSPQHNVDQERERLRLRARLGADINLESGWTAGIRIATGDSNTPVSGNQTFGLANQGQGGNFSKYAIWLDRGFIRYDIGGGVSYTEQTSPGPDGKTLQTVMVPHESPGELSLFFGRSDNPFFTTSEIIWDEDVGFDGLALQARYEICSGVTPFIAGGLFPIFNTDLNFSSNQPAKYESTDKWLYAAQFGLDLKFGRAAAAKVGVSYFDFQGVEGTPSDPFLPFTSQDQSNTDNTRPSFAQKGNTYRAIRSIVPDALNNFGTSNQFQYFGLASPFQVLSYTARLDLNYFEPFQVSFLGEYAKNLAFDKSAIEATAVNNRGPLPPVPVPDPAAPAATPTDGTTTDTSAPPPIGAYEGGDTAWNLALIVGKPVFEKAGDWNVSFGYRHVESDAVVDAFTDSDFAGGGTNVKGYTVGAAIALSPRVKFGVRWMGATQIAGPPLKSDVLLLDLSAKF